MAERIRRLSRGDGQGELRFGQRKWVHGSHTSMSTTEKERSGPHLVDYDWYAFRQTLYKGIEEKRLERVVRCLQRNEQGSGGVKRPQEAQKARALWKMKAAKEAGEEYCDSTRKDNIRKRSEKRSAL